MKWFTLFGLVTIALAAPSPRKAKAPPVPAINCTQVQLDLQNGIQANLDIQAQELTSVQSLQLQDGTADFETTRQSVLSIQHQGITRRAENQKLAKDIKSPATEGLVTVAEAQTKEMMQVMSLTGTAADVDTLKQLVQEVLDGTRQNEKNLAAAKGQKCAT